MRTKSTIIIAFSLALLVGLSSFVYGPPKWTKLGSRLVNFRGDHDEIVVTAYKGTFTGLKFKVKRSPIHITNVNIIYGNGTNTNIVIGKRLPAGSESRVFDLPGDRRIIKRIKFNYKTAQRPGPQPKALVEVWGRR